MNLNKFFQSKKSKLIAGVVVGLLVLLLVFKVGVIIGYRKANFSYRWGENYHRNFGGPRGGFMRGFYDRDFIGAHGVFGQIIKMDGPALVVKGKDDVEKIVLMKDTTLIKRFHDTLRPSDLRPDDYIVVIGDPNDSGQLEAKFIRALPSPRL